MEKQIIRDLVGPGVSLEEQKTIVSKLSIIENSLGDDTKVILNFIKRRNENNSLVNEKILYTYISLNRKDIFLDDYFWDTVERDIDLDTATDKLISDELKVFNKDLVTEAYRKFREDGDTSHFDNLPFKITSNGSDLIGVDSAVDETLEKLRRIKDKEDTGMVSFTNKNFFNLNLVIKGFEPGELILVAARPAVGKTAMAIAFADDLSLNNKVLFISLEMPVTELMERMLITKSGVTKNIMHSINKFDDNVYRSLLEAGEEIKKQNITFMTRTGDSFLELASFLREQQRKEKFDVIFLDYLGLIPTYDGKSEDIRTTTTKVSRGLKLLAMELGVPIIAAQQVSRNMTHGTRTKAEYIPLQLTDLRDSGSLEQDANKVLLLWNDEPETDFEEQELQKEQRSRLMLYIAKNRGGQSGDKILYNYRKAYQRIHEISWLTKPDTFSTKEDK